MKITFSKKFTKEFKKLPQAMKELVMDALEMLEDNPNHPLLNNHALNREYAGCNAISADDDLRIIYRQKNNYTYVIMLRVGKHDDIY